MTANAGYHAYATGDVLTASQVQYNLQNQTVMYFATTTARDAALTGAILVEGMVSYTPATGLMYYNGSAWTAVGGSSVPTSYGFTAGKNKIINGDFGVNQRNFTSNTASGSFNFDRWSQLNGDGSFTTTPQNFTAGTAPVAGYEGKTFLQGIVAGQTLTSAYAIYGQRIEDVRAFAGQTVTLSYWAKTTSGTPKIAIEVEQYFGTGGSPSAVVQTTVGANTTSTSWTRYSQSFTMPSLSGKTVGTNNDSYVGLNLWVSAGSTYNTRASSIGIQNNTFQIWGVQLEANSTATAFQTATGTIQGELAACQRYYYQTVADNAYTQFGNGMAKSSTSAQIMIPFPVTMRTLPTLASYSSLNLFDGATISGLSSVTLNYGGRNVGSVNCVGTFTQFRPCFMLSDNTTAGYIAFSAEL